MCGRFSFLEVVIYISWIFVTGNLILILVPSQPRNLVQEDVVVTEEKDGEGRGQVKVKWDPPLHTSDTNRLKGYSLMLGEPYNTKDLNHSLAAHSAFGIATLTRSQTTFHIPGVSSFHI